MTFVGKILVCVIMLFAVLFMSVSLVVFTTEKNWREETKKQREANSKIQAQLNDAKAQVQAKEGELKVAQDEQKKQKEDLEREITRLKDETKRAQTQLSEQIKVVETSQENAKAAQAEAKAHFEEATKLREDLRTVQLQANELKLHQTELNDQIRTLERDNEVANSNNRQLRDRNAVYTSKLRQLGQSTDVNALRGNASTPKNDVEGEVTKYDERTKMVEISIGSDDGLVEGNELDVYRTKPAPEYIGKIRLEGVDNDHSVGRVIGKTIKGLKIKEHDIVSTKIRARS